MAQSRQCPTRVDGGDSLIAHVITLEVCTKRQREHYHKCYTCVHQGAGASLTPAAPASLPARKQAPTVEFAAEPKS